MRTLFLLCVVSLLTGCSAAGFRADTCRYLPASPPQGVVFVANGSGDFRSVSTNLSRAVAEAGLPLEIETAVWSHGYGRYIADHVDHENHLVEGDRLAEQVSAYSRTYPGRKIYLIGHSAGCAVVLRAAERLPPDSVDRIILLAPSVCTEYDLRPALRTARGGIDAFTSEEDRVVLGLGMRIVGTADRRCRTAAGQYGFTPVIDAPGDAALYQRLRQHPWDPMVAWSGHEGGHYGSNQTGYLRAYVLPLLAGESAR
jgi:pimeloyl-ACP methyl ester carboxylesterase